MKATGIVRRVDDLGRIVIPKEIRRTYESGRAPVVNIIDSERKVCLCSCEQRKQNLFVDIPRNLHCIPKKAKHFKKGVAKRDTLSICDDSWAA